MKKKITQIIGGIICTCLFMVGMVNTASATITAPFTETFDAVVPPAGWQTYVTSGSNWSYRSSGTTSTAACGSDPVSDHTGNGGGYALMDQSSTDVGNVLEMDTVDLSGMTNACVDFWYFMCDQFGASYNVPNELYVEYWDGTTWVTIGSIIQGTAGWENFIFPIQTATFAPDMALIRFRAESGGASWDYAGDNLIDDVSVAECPSCVSPSILAANNITGTSADLSWTENNVPAATEWVVEWGPQGFSPGTGTTVNTTTNPHSLTGLMVATCYDYYVASVCGPADTSSVTGPFTFCTPCPPTFVVTPGNPVCAGFEGGLDNCWDNTNTGLTGTEIWNTSGVASWGGATTANTGTGFAWVDNSTPNPDGITISSPMLDLSAVACAQVSFWWWSNTTATGANELYTTNDVQYFDGLSWVTVGTISQNGGAQWNNSTFIIPTTATQIRIVNDQTGTYCCGNDFAIDDLCIEECPSCLPATADSCAYDAVNQCLNFYFTPDALNDSIHLQVGALGFTPSGAGGVFDTTIVATSSPVCIPWAASCDLFDFAVRGLCLDMGMVDSAAWSANTTCGPVIDPCLADAGTANIDASITAGGTGAVADPYIVCGFSTLVQFQSALDYVHSPCASPDSGIAWAIYNDQGPSGTNPLTDPNYLNSFFEADTQGLVIVGATGVPVTFCMVPYTDNDLTNGLLDDDGCNALGSPICVTWIAPMTIASTQDCSGGWGNITSTVTVSGGLPAFDGTSMYTMLPSTTGAPVQSGAQGGTFTYSGMNKGDMYIIEVVGPCGDTASLNIFEACDCEVIGLPDPMLEDSIYICAGDDAMITPMDTACGMFYLYDMAAATPGTEIDSSNTGFTITGATGTECYYVKDSTRSVSSCADALKITEMNMNSPDIVEIEALADCDFTGYSVVSSGSNGIVNSVNGTPQALGPMTAGQVIYWDDVSGSAQYWGSNLPYFSGVPWWIMIIDENTCTVVDAMFVNYTAAEIATLNINFGACVITAADLGWTGPGIDEVGLGCSGAVERTSTGDTDSAADWGCGGPSGGTNNGTAYTISGAPSCASNVVEVCIVETTASPVISTDAPTQNVCENSPGFVAATCPPGFETVWYSDAAATMMVGTGDTIIIPAPGMSTTITYYAQCECAAVAAVPGEGTGGMENSMMMTTPVSCPFDDMNCFAPLPVELISFSGVIGEGYNDLFWSTASEENTQWMIIDRSEDGVNNFLEVGRLDAAGNSTSTLDYQLRDNNPLPAAYYRLRVIDLDGTESLSHTIYLAQKTTFGLVRTFPVPTKGLVNVEFETTAKGDITFRMMDMLGRTVHTSSAIFEEGRHIKVFNMKELTSGVYAVEIDNGVETFVTKVVKND